MPAVYSTGRACISRYARLRRSSGKSLAPVYHRRERSGGARLEADSRRHDLMATSVHCANPAEETVCHYESHDLLLFPSLHDSGGYVVLEALSHGMPVVCLDLGGPRDIVTTSSGIVVKTGGRNTAQVAKDMADKICRLLESPQRMAELSAGAVSRAREFLLPGRVKEFYDLAATFVAPVSSHFLPNALPASCSDPDA